jgi:orotidine-5'-phosphate decarboxylase
MTRDQLVEQINKKSSYLCVGLDTDIAKIPQHLLKAEDPVFEFNRAIIDATKDLAVAFKINTAFYEALGSEGWDTMKRTIRHIPEDCLTIADAKRGDIGNTSTMYAKAFYEMLGADAVTVAPYMGSDSVKPFLEFKDKWVILLAHTSNEGAGDFQTLNTGSQLLYEEVITRSQQWGTPDNLMYVVGATKANKVASIRRLAPDHFFLVPGIGAQGGDLAEVSKHGLNKQCGLIVNASRSIIYASNGQDFPDKARDEAKRMVNLMKTCLDSNSI